MRNWKYIGLGHRQGHRNSAGAVLDRVPLATGLMRSRLRGRGCVGLLCRRIRWELVRMGCEFSAKCQGTEGSNSKITWESQETHGAFVYEFTSYLDRACDHIYILQTSKSVDVVLDKMASETEVSNMLLVAMLPPLHHRERVYLQIENDSVQYERFVAGVRLTHNTGSFLVIPFTFFVVCR